MNFFCFLSKSHKEVSSNIPRTRVPDTTLLLESSSRPILVLYGTTRGASLKAAEYFVSQCSEELSEHRAKELTGKSDLLVKCEGPISLDDFLNEPNWAPLVVIFVSSLGSGDGPMKGRKFRKQCDAWIKAHQDMSDKSKPLQGIRFALCGLGDSSYDFYMKNPIGENSPA